ncbi:MAG: hypothetical protein N2556_04305 [Anaerolineae bacterium]|nr:hypothetical protein [Anaerolineae bacterium]
MNTGTIAIIALSVFLFLWYIGGHLYNRQRGRQLFRWLEEGLKVLGDEYQWGWLGSPASGARVLIHQAHPPFRRMEITLLLENREIPILWLADRLQKKRDSAILKATLRSPGNEEIQAGPPNELRDPSILSWSHEKGPHGLMVVYKGSGASSQLAKLAPWLARYGPHLRRFILQRQDPHMAVWMNLTGLVSEVPSSALFTDLQAALGARKDGT